MISFKDSSSESSFEITGMLLSYSFGSLPRMEMLKEEDEIDFIRRRAKYTKTITRAFVLVDDYRVVYPLVFNCNKRILWTHIDDTDFHIVRILPNAFIRFLKSCYIPSYLRKYGVYINDQSLLERIEHEIIDNRVLGRPYNRILSVKLRGVLCRSDVWPFNYELRNVVQMTALSNAYTA